MSKVNDHRHAVHELVGVFVVLPLHAVVFVEASAMRRNGVLAESVGVPDEVEVTRRPPQDLSADARLAVVLAIRLPSVDQPGFELQLIGREPLDAEAVEEPGSVGRHVGRLIRPVIEAVVTEQSDIGHEDAGLEVRVRAGRPCDSPHSLRRCTGRRRQVSTDRLSGWRHCGARRWRRRRSAIRILPCM